MTGETGLGKQAEENFYNKNGMYRLLGHILQKLEKSQNILIYLLSG
jgi:hypothetical protein